jgi:plastocyanin
MLRLVAIVTSGLLVGAGGMALADDVQRATTAQTAITIDNFAFGPANIAINAGTTVTWTNHDDEPHTVVNVTDSKLFKSSALDTDDTFSFTFDKPGTYQYFCSIHPRMVGTVEVN